MLVDFFDGRGLVNHCEVIAVSRDDVKLHCKNTETLTRRSPLILTLALNPLKGGNEEYVIRMAAAMDVHLLLPVIFSRSEVPFDPDILAKRTDRWKRICISEIALSGGAWLPEILPPVEFDKIPGIKGSVLIFDEDADPETQLPSIRTGSVVTAFTGPEGGLERTEVALARQRNYMVASLGNWTLRTELAGALVPFWCYSLAENWEL